DILSPLSDELLLRILSFLPLQHLLAVAPVSRRFYHLAADSQLWKALYYARFVLPRAMRIPGFRDGSTAGAGHKLHYSGRRTLWADGRRGGLVRDEREEERARTTLTEALGAAGREEGDDDKGGEGGREGVEEEEPLPLEQKPQGVNWKRQYKIRYNWSRGRCAVEELRIGGGGGGGGKMDTGDEPDAKQGGGKKVLAKVVEGIAITADRTGALRAWDLKSRQLIAQVSLDEEGHADGDAAAADAAEPSCISLDEARFDRGILDVAVGFLDGGFGIWRLRTGEKRFVRRYRHQKSSNGGLTAMALSYPYLLTATESVLISLYTFDVPSETGDNQDAKEEDDSTKEVSGQESESQSSAHLTVSASSVSAPYLLTSLKSHSSRPPLALSIRKMAATTIASIAYTFSTRRGWSIGIQDLHIRPASTHGIKAAPEITTTRIAYTTPIDASGPSQSPISPPATPRRQNVAGPLEPGSPAVLDDPGHPEPGPTTLCYTHPYLLATLPDNTLVLHMCTSNTSSLSISRGIRLWGHTSGISDAEITARGKAVSVSSRGEEMRVWELEGKSTGIGSRSVEIRPGQSSPAGHSNGLSGGDNSASALRDWDERRNWVGFDDEMVIVLKETAKEGRESLMVYDFT
ncbi:hypothetical protein B0T26DRAFT_613466, partial [Lasiosphaeria miniovina]